MPGIRSRPPSGPVRTIGARSKSVVNIPRRSTSSFPRPVVDLPGEYFNLSKWQGPKGLGRERTHEKLFDLWNRLVEQVHDAGLALGTHAELPERRVR